jgi:hypothetical protein
VARTRVGEGIARQNCTCGFPWDAPGSGDNAQQEGFWATLKTEFYDRHFDNHVQAITAVSRWIDTSTTDAAGTVHSDRSIQYHSNTT